MDQPTIISPIVTEKAMKASEGGKYSFIVANRSTKTDIKNAIKSMFKVNVVEVRTMVVKGKKIRVGMRRIEIAKPRWKKALVKLKKGEKIGILEPGKGEEEKKKKK